MGASLSILYAILTGVPQGSILSPLFFNVLADLSLPMHSHLTVYADDIGIISRVPTLTEAEELLQDAATALGDWVITWGLSVNVLEIRTFFSGLS